MKKADLNWFPFLKFWRWLEIHGFNLSWILDHCFRASWNMLSTLQICLQRQTEVSPLSHTERPPGDPKPTQDQIS